MKDQGAQKSQQQRQSREGDQKWDRRDIHMLTADHPKAEPSTGAARRNRYYLELEEISTSFFFTDFPNEWTSRSMWSFFNRFGLVVDIYVPLKYSKDGRRFGFVHYKGVCDTVVLITKI